MCDSELQLMDEALGKFLQMWKLILYMVKLYCRRTGHKLFPYCKVTLKKRHSVFEIHSTYFILMMVIYNGNNL